MVALKEALKHLRSQVIDHPELFAHRQRREARHVATLFSGLARSPKYHLLLSASGHGNVGDQAMAEAFFENVSGPIVVIQRREGDVRVPEECAGRVTLVDVPALISGGFSRPRKALEEFRLLLEGASSYSVVGADIMDGAYSYRHSVRRISTATYAALAGVDSRILGFSWNESPDPRSAMAIRDAAAAGVKLLTRDPASARRLRTLVGDRVQEAADVAVSARWVSQDAVARFCPGLKPPYAVLNANGIIGGAFDQVPDYVAIVRWLVQRGLSIVLVPHDSRPGVSDVAECRRVYEAVQGPVWLVDKILSPRDVRGLTRGADLVFSGRMHLSILALWSGVPSVTLARQGKVEGLAELFGLEECVVTPSPGFAEQCVRVLERILADPASYRSRTAAGLERARRLSMENYAGLPLRS